MPQTRYNNSFLKHKIILEKFEKWFELNLGWFFVNGRKQAARFKYLKKKYGEK